MNEKVDITKYAKFGQTGVPFPVEEPNEFAYMDFVKYAKKNEKKIKSQLSKLRDDRIFKVVEMIWTVWDKKTNKGAFSNIRGNKFGRSLVKMLHGDNIIFNKNSHKIVQIKELLKVEIKNILETIQLPIEIGDTVMMGKFKNKPVVVKDISWNEKGDLLINGKSAMRMRIPKKQNIFGE